MNKDHSILTVKHIYHVLQVHKSEIRIEVIHDERNTKKSILAEELLKTPECNKKWYCKAQHKAIRNNVTKTMKSMKEVSEWERKLI